MMALNVPCEEPSPADVHLPSVHLPPLETGVPHVMAPVPNVPEVPTGSGVPTVPHPLSGTTESTMTHGLAVPTVPSLPQALAMPTVPMVPTVISQEAPASIPNMPTVPTVLAGGLTIHMVPTLTPVGGVGLLAEAARVFLESPPLMTHEPTDSASWQGRGPVHVSCSALPIEEVVQLSDLGPDEVLLLDLPQEWSCQWRGCRGRGEEPVDSHLLNHVKKTVQIAQSCKMDTCTGHNMLPRANHIRLHLANLNYDDSGKVRCTWEGNCTRRFTDADKYRKHIETHILLDTSRYHCGWLGCPSRGFGSPKELVNHAFEAHLRAGQLPAPSSEFKQCQWQGCEYAVMDSTLEEATQISMLRDHITHYHTNWDPNLPERGLVCRWGNCHRFFTDKTKFLHHACVHTGMKTFGCQEAGCAQTFTSESQLRAHMRRHSKFYKCTVCAAEGIDKSYTSGFNLKEHMRNVHQQQRLVCKTCSRSYKSHKAWSAHLRSCVRTLKTTGFQPY